MSRHSGAFVYTGAGKNQAENADICVKACKKIACEIQYCLARNDHKQARCQNFVNSWSECCSQAKEAELHRVNSIGKPVSESQENK